MFDFLSNTAVEPLFTCIIPPLFVLSTLSVYNLPLGLTVIVPFQVSFLSNSSNAPLFMFTNASFEILIITSD